MTIKSYAKRHDISVSKSMGRAVKALAAAEVGAQERA
jgi:hypothetical protein